VTPNEDPSQPAAEEPAVDFEQLHAAAADDDDLLKELVELYFNQAKEIMAGLTAALQKGAAKDVDHLAHKLVGASLACGMSAMVPPLRELENRGKEGKLGDAEALYDRASRHLELTRNKVGTYIRQHQNQ
jgi:HPt (histidine-containing phosphotransfer) domain-containing protein